MEREALKRIVETHAPSVYRLAYARTGNRDDAEDVMQEGLPPPGAVGAGVPDDGHCRAWLLG